MTTILVSVSPGERRIAAVLDGRLLDYGLDRPGGGPAVGDLRRARITARVPAMAGAFAAIGARQDGFLPDSAGGAGVREGDRLVVRVVRAAQGGKGARLEALTDRAASDGPPGLLARGPGALGQLRGLHPRASLVVDDAGFLAELPDSVRAGARLVPRAFDDAIEAEVAALGEPEVALDGGGSLTIEPTRTLVAIDVDLGGSAAGRVGKTAAHRATNQTAIVEIARQIRLRALGGAIVVDLAGLSPRRRAAFADTFVAALADDPAGARFLGFSALGLAEIVRSRGEAPLHERLASAHGAALAALRALTLACAAEPARAPCLWAALDVAEAAMQDAFALTEAAHRLGRAARIQPLPAAPSRHWSLDPP